VEEGRIDHLVDVELLEISRVLRHLHGLGIEPPDEAVEEETYQD
jgi:hypothetical protein